MKRQNEYIIIWAMFWLFTAAMCLVIGVGKCSGEDAQLGQRILVYTFDKNGNLIVDPSHKPMHIARLADWEGGVPNWVFVGVAMVESSSYWTDGELTYVDKEDGDDGERGPFQVTRDAFREVAGPGDDFARLRSEPIFASKIFERIMLKLYKATGSWSRSVRAYNCGLKGSLRHGWEYLAAVKAAAADAQ